VFFTTLAISGGLLLLWELRALVEWTLVSIVVAVALSPAVDALLRRRVPRGLAIVIVYVVLVLGIVGIGALVVPPLSSQMRDLVEYLVRYAEAPEDLPRAAEELATRYGLGGYAASLLAQASVLPGQLSAAAGPLLAVIKGIVTSVTALITILILTYFLLLDGERFVTAGLFLVTPAQRPRLRRLMRHSADAIHGYVIGNLAISLIAGVAACVALMLLHVPYPVALALIVALFDLLPLVGAFIGAGVAVLVALSIGPMTAIILAVFFAVYQQVENHLLQPLVYGRAVRLHPLGVILAVLAGAELLGIIGALLAIPVAEILRVVVAEWLASRARETGGIAHAADDGAPIETVTADTAGPVARP
jgi:predicted PurR-regulated permease PerM